MHRADSSCTWDELVRLNAFSIERHALQIKQPMEVYDGAYRVACANANGEHYWSQLDYSKGFSDWWWLSHTDFKVRYSKLLTAFTFKFLAYPVSWPCGTTGPL